MLIVDRNSLNSTAYLTAEGIPISRLLPFDMLRSQTHNR